MNQTMILNISRAVIDNSIARVSEENSGKITTGILLVIGKIAEVLTDVGQNHGFWKFLILLFAILGFFAVLSAIFSKLAKGLGIIFKIFIIMPLIVIVGLINRKKRKQRLLQLGELRKEMKIQNKKISRKMWVFWIITHIILPLIIFVFVILVFII